MTAYEGVHEDDAGRRIARAIMGKHMELTSPKEGKVSIISTVDGLFKVNPEILYELNRIQDVLVGTLPNRYPVKSAES